MAGKLAIVTGWGRLTEEVLALAESLPGGFTQFLIKPWMPRLLSEPANVFSEFFGRSKGVPALSPFRFSEIEHDLMDAAIKSVYLTGDFPRDRFVQVELRQRLWGDLSGVADEKCFQYFSETSSGFSPAIRYFLALTRLLEECDIRPLLAHELFPSLNLPVGLTSVVNAPPQVLENLPAVIGGVSEDLHSRPSTELRFSQAVIVDNGIPIEVEATGTDGLLTRYRRRKIKHAPYLLKLPSIEFNPALDQPTIGPQTVQNCLAAGVRGIVVCAETTIVVSKRATIEAVNEGGDVSLRATV